MFYFVLLSVCLLFLSVCLYVFLALLSLGLSMCRGSLHLPRAVCHMPSLVSSKSPSLTSILSESLTYRCLPALFAWCSRTKQMPHLDGAGRSVMAAAADSGQVEMMRYLTFTQVGRLLLFVLSSCCFGPCCYQVEFHQPQPPSPPRPCVTCALRPAHFFSPAVLVHVYINPHCTKRFGRPHSGIETS